jgi:catechol 2,3-dioxygenase-like lactoylglutathione lyase family enzyme
MADPLTGPWREVVVSVRDLGAWSRALNQLFGWEELTRGKTDPRLLKSWALPGTATAEERILTAPSDPERQIRLVSFKGVTQTETRTNAAPWDTGGFFSLLVYVRDVDATYKDALKLGWSAYNPPSDMEFGAMTLRNVVLRGPDSVSIGLYTQRTPPLPNFPYDKATSPVSIQQMVRDIEAARRFYKDLMRWVPSFDGVTNLKSNQFGLPPERVGMSKKVITASDKKIAPSQTWLVGQVELVQWDGLTGRDFSAACVPPNLGIISLRVPVTDVKAAAKTLTANDVSVFANITRTSLAAGREADIFAVRSPDGAMIEFFQEY